MRTYYPASGAGKKRLAADIYEQTKSICYYFAFDMLRDHEEALLAIRRTMVRMMRSYEIIHPENSGELKRAAAILCRYVALDILHSKGREESLPEPQEDDGQESVSTGRIDIYRALDAIGRLPSRSRTVVLLNGVFRMTDPDIAEVLRMSMYAVGQRRTQGRRFLYQAMNPRRQEGEKPSKEEWAAVNDALALWLSQKIVWAEAIANVDPPELSEEFERETLRQMVADPSFFESFAEGVRRNKLRAAAILVGIAALAVLIGLYGRGTPSEEGSVPAMQRVKSQIALAAGYNPSASENSQTSLREVPASMYFVSGDTLVFIDPDTLLLYRLEKGVAPKELCNLAPAAKTHLGIERVGVHGKAIHLAFVDGTGAEVIGNPAEVSITPYWQTAWFEGSDPLTVQMKKGVRINNTMFTFAVK